MADNGELYEPAAVRVLERSPEFAAHAAYALGTATDVLHVVDGDEPLSAARQLEAALR